MKVLCSVFIPGRIAATHMAALQTQPQMHPAIAHFQTLFATLRMRLQFFRVFDVLAGLTHEGEFSLSENGAVGCLKGSLTVKHVFPGSDSTSINP